LYFDFRIVDRIDRRDPHPQHLGALRLAALFSTLETDDDVDVPTSTSTSARNTSISSPRHHNHDEVGANPAVIDYKADCHESVKIQAA
jgi:hypothetical protein